MAGFWADFEGRVNWIYGWIAYELRPTGL
jgi:hypothetical protein